MFKQFVPFLVLSTFVACVCQPTQTVQAQDKTKPVSAEKYTAKSMIALMDKNGDGKISKEEAPPDVKTNFDYIDTNHDGSIDIKEAKAMADYANNEKGQSAQSGKPKKATAKSMIALMDKDGDGKISKQEAPAELKTYFEVVDSDGSGTIDLEEAKTIAKYANEQQGETEKPTDTKPKTTKGITAKQFIAALDKDGDGKVSKSETFGQMKTNFTYMDSDGNGLIDSAEAQASLDYAKENGLVFELGPKMEDPKASVEPARSTEETITKLDKNGDGKITWKEAPEDLRLFFSNYDTNEDGSIDKQESAALVAYINDGTVESPAKKADSKTPLNPKTTAKTVMKQMDLDSDGKITKEEAPDALKESFAYVDTNKDGVIDIKEAQSIADFMNKQNK